MKKAYYLTLYVMLYISLFPFLPALRRRKALRVRWAKHVRELNAAHGRN